MPVRAKLERQALATHQWLAVNNAIAVLLHGHLDFQVGDFSRGRRACGVWGTRRL